MNHGVQIFGIERMSAQEFKLTNKDGETIKRLRGDVASRIFSLTQKTDDIKTFNCFGTVDYILGRNENLDYIMWRRAEGTRMNLDAALLQGTFPFAFELYGKWSVPGEFNIGHDVVEGIFHEGIVLGKHGEDIIVFDKPGTLPPRMTTMKEVLADFPETEEIRCFAPGQS